MFKKENIFFFISCGLLLTLLFVYKNYVHLRTEHNLLKNKISNNDIEFTNYSLDKDYRPFYTKGDIFQAISAFTTEDKVTQQPQAIDVKKILIFASGDCVYCKDYYPSIDSLVREVPDLNLYVLQSDTTPSENSEFLKSNKFKFNMLTVEDSIYANLNIAYTPTTFFLNSDNTISTFFDVVLNKKQLLNNIN